MRRIIHYMKHKVYLRKLSRSLKKIIEYEKNTGSISEIDTQILLVEPVLAISGYSINNINIVKRANRSKNCKNFDIEVYHKNTIKLAIEVKSFSSKEFNIEEILKNPKKTKSVYKHNNDKILIGTTKCYTENGTNVWRNCNGDGVGQLRAYLQNYGYAKKNNKPVPILTNGKIWVLFTKEFYSSTKPICKKKHILARGSIEDKDFYKKIIRELITFRCT